MLHKPVCAQAITIIYSAINSHKTNPFPNIFFINFRIYCIDYKVDVNGDTDPCHSEENFPVTVFPAA